MKQWYINKWLYLDIAYTYKARLARDFGGIFDNFWDGVRLIPADPLTACPDEIIHNAKELKGNNVWGIGK